MPDERKGGVRSSSVPLMQTTKHHATPYFDENGECDRRKQLRERFSFYTESHKPRKLKPIAAECYSTFHKSSRDQLDNEEATDIAAGVVRRALKEARAVLRDEMRRRSDIVSEEGDARSEMMRFASLTEDQLRCRDFATTVTNFSLSVVDAEADNSSFFSLNGSFVMPPKPRSSFHAISTNSRNGFVMIAKETSRRQAMEEQMLADIRALVRAAKRELTATAARLEQEAKAQREAERLEKAERDWRERLLTEGAATISAEEELAQYCSVVVPEMAERAVAEAHFRDGLHVISTAVSAQRFDDVMSGHFKVLAQETNRRDAIETEQNQGFIQLKAAMLLVDKLLSAETLKRSVSLLVAQEAKIRGRREASFLRLQGQQSVELRAQHWLDIYHQLWRGGAAFVSPTAASFLLYLEDVGRQSVVDEWHRFVSRVLPDWEEALAKMDVQALAALEGPPRPPSADPSASGTEDARSSQVVSRHSAGSSRRPWSRPTNSASMAHRVPTGRHDATSLPPMPPPQSVERRPS